MKSRISRYGKGRKMQLEGNDLDGESVEKYRVCPDGAVGTRRVKTGKMLGPGT
jgi:hypothetical protein